MDQKKIGDFIHRMARDAKLRRDFCADPASVLGREGVELPPEYVPRGPLDEKELGERLNASLLGGNMMLQPFGSGTESGTGSSAVYASKHTDGGRHADGGIIGVSVKTGTHNDDGSPSSSTPSLY